MSEYTYFICVDKDIDLIDFIEVYNVAIYHEDAVGYSELTYDTEVDENFYKHIHIISTYNSLDNFEHFEKYIINMGYIFPDDNTLDDTFYEKSDAEAAIEDYITQIAELKAQEYINDPWSKYDC